MRVFIAVLVLIFSFQSWTKADDISDFEIEGISIGDSLLDYFSQEEITKNIMWDYNDNKKNNKFVIVEFFSLQSAETYHGVQLMIKSADKKYKIYGIVGAIPFRENIKDCYSKMREIEAELSQIFKSSEKSNHSKEKLRLDETGKSTYTGVYFTFEDGGNASVQCYDYSKAMSPNVDNLRVTIRTKEYRNWYYDAVK